MRLTAKRPRRTKTPIFKLRGLWPYPHPRAVEAMEQYEKIDIRMRQLLDEYGHAHVTNAIRGKMFTSWEEIAEACRNALN